MQTITIDRFDEEYAICGDILTLQDGIFHLDTEATEARRRRIRKK